MKGFNSFRFQLGSAIFILILLLALLTVFGLQAVTNAFTRQATVNLIGQQRASALLLEIYFDQMGDDLTPEERAGLTELIQNTLQSVETGLAALRFGNSALNVAAIENPIFLAVLDDMDARWQELRATVEDALLLERAEIATLDDTLERQTLTVYAFADQLAKALNTLAEQDIAAYQQAVFIIISISVLFIGLAYFIITKTAQSVNQLQQATIAFGAGDFKQRAKINGSNEIAKVAQSFNNMAEQLDYLVEQITLQLSETIAAREQAERADKVKSSFLASMSHELRTPLNSIINFTRFVVDGDTGAVNEQQTELLNEVVNSGKHLLNLINDVLDMSKIDAGSLKLFVEDNVNISALLNNCLKTAESLLIGKPVHLHTEIQLDLPLVRGDKQRITQILLNILSNACKFTEEGSIRVVASQTDSEVYIAIADTGPGIKPEDQRLVFEAFKQTSTGLRQAGGTGLGMPIAKSLAEAHGGSLWLESDYGRGTTFYLTLPIKSAVLVPVLI